MSDLISIRLDRQEAVILFSDYLAHRAEVIRKGTRGFAGSTPSNQALTRRQVLEHIAAMRNDLDLLESALTYEVKDK